jgi:hypothetical protein
LKEIKANLAPLRRGIIRWEAPALLLMKGFLKTFLGKSGFPRSNLVACGRRPLTVLLMCWTRHHYLELKRVQIGMRFIRTLLTRAFHCQLVELPNCDGTRFAY